MNMKQTNEIKHAEVMTSEDVRIFFKIDSIETSLSVYGNDTRWKGSLWQKGKMIASYFSVSTCEMGYESGTEIESYAEINDELEEYKADPIGYCTKHDSEIDEWVNQLCLECYYEMLYEEGYTEENGIPLEDFCQFHQIGEVGNFNNQEVPDFKNLQDFFSYFSDPCHFYVSWDAVISISCDDAYVGDLWGDDDWGFDKEAYDSYPQYIPCKVNCQVNEERTFVVTIDFNKDFISNLDTGNSYSQIIESCEFQRKVEQALLGKTIEEAETYCKTNHIKIG